MKVLTSLKPYYYYLIGEKIKTLEIRKSDLKNLPQDVLFYMSKDEKSFAKIPKGFQEKYRKHFGKVGIEFTCDKSICLDYYPQDYTGMPGKFSEMICKESCLSYNEIMAYKKEKLAYGWHISNLKVYGEPKELSELWGRKNCLAAHTVECWNCFAACREINGKHYQPLRRPPQSWCYIEETALWTNK